MIRQLENERSPCVKRLRNAQFEGRIFEKFQNRVDDFSVKGSVCVGMGGVSHNLQIIH